MCICVCVCLNMYVSEETTETLHTEQYKKIRLFSNYANSTQVGLGFKKRAQLLGFKM